ncbi:MAG TPA: cytochrome c oxidase subunit 3 [Terriglobales bacterium]|nr:cytochrome c oxidase subunit 3 [Terriglobales bacterium]
MVVAIWLAMISVTSLFLALTYAYLYRHGLTTGWLSGHLAAILSANTAILIASSLALHRGGEFFKIRQATAALGWLVTAFILGVLFLVGQAWAWSVLFAAGVYAGNQPNSGFFFLVTALHAAHLSIALGLLFWVVSRVARGRLPAERPLILQLTAIVWHMLDITWVYLYLVIVLYR